MHENRDAQNLKHLVSGSATDVERNCILPEKQTMSLRCLCGLRSDTLPLHTWLAQTVLCIQYMEQSRVGAELYGFYVTGKTIVTLRVGMAGAPFCELATVDPQHEDSIADEF